MKHRVRVELSFDTQTDAEALMAYAKNLSGRAVNINEGKANEEISFYELEICHHDEGSPCIRVDRVEVRTL